MPKDDFRRTLPGVPTRHQRSDLSSTEAEAIYQQLLKLQSEIDGRVERIEHYLAEDQIQRSVAPLSSVPPKRRMHPIAYAAGIITALGALVTPITTALISQQRKSDELAQQLAEAQKALALLQTAEVQKAARLNRLEVHQIDEYEDELGYRKKKAEEQRRKRKDVEDAPPTPPERPEPQR